jgi:hypothetical protein
MSKKGKIIGVSVTLVTIITGLIIANRIYKKKIADDILESIDKDTGGSGNWTDLKTSGALDPNFHKTINKSTCKKSSAWLNNSASLFDSNTKLYRSTDESAVLSEIKKYRSKEQISQLSEAFTKLTGDDFYTRLKNIDARLAGIRIEKDYLPDINTYINGLPNYVEPPCK